VQKIWTLFTEKQLIKEGFFKKLTNLDFYEGYYSINEESFIQQRDLLKRGEDYVKLFLNRKFT